MKVLVDRFTNKITGTYSEPLSFPISGSYVIDLPDSLGIKPENDSVADLLSKKSGAFRRAYPSLDGSRFFNDFAAGFGLAIHGETFIRAPQTGVCIAPGGFFITEEISVGGANNMFFHFSTFRLGRSSNGNSTEVMYNHDQNGVFSPPNFLDIYCSVTTSLGSVFVESLQNDVVVPSTVPPLFNIRFDNSGDHPIFISDWTLLFDLEKLGSRIVSVLVTRTLMRDEYEMDLNLKSRETRI